MKACGVCPRGQKILGTALLTLSVLRVRFYFYCLVARNMPSSDTASLKEKFCELPGSMFDKLKRLHSEVFTEVHWGRLLVFSHMPRLGKNFHS